MRFNEFLIGRKAIVISYPLVPPLIPVGSASIPGPALVNKTAVYCRAGGFPPQV